MTETNDPEDAVYTDWLANCQYGYGFGYTPEQAIAAMAQQVRVDDDNTVEVRLYEHVGGVTLSAFKVDFDGEVHAAHEVTVNGERMNELRSAALDAYGLATQIKQDAEELEDGIVENE